MFQYFKDFLNNLVKELPNISNNLRKEKDMLDYTFQEPLYDISPVIY